jgi:hypothetical protein
VYPGDCSRTHSRIPPAALTAPPLTHSRACIGGGAALAAAVKAKREAKRKQALTTAQDHLKSALKKTSLEKWELSDGVQLLNLGLFPPVAVGDPAQGWCDRTHLYPPGYQTVWNDPVGGGRYSCQVRPSTESRRTKIAGFDDRGCVACEARRTGV